MDHPASETFRAATDHARARMGGIPLWQRVVAWMLIIAMLGVGVLLLAGGLIVGGIVVLTVLAIVGVRSLWRRITGTGTEGRENVRVIVRR